LRALTGSVRAVDHDETTLQFVRESVHGQEYRVLPGKRQVRSVECEDSQAEFFILVKQTYRSLAKIPSVRAWVEGERVQNGSDRKTHPNAGRVGDEVFPERSEESLCENLRTKRLWTYHSPKIHIDNKAIMNSNLVSQVYFVQQDEHPAWDYLAWVSSCHE
jgi:hypothetical protein